MFASKRILVLLGLLLVLTGLAPTIPRTTSADPIYSPSPPSTLFAPGTTSFTFSVHTTAPAACAYSLVSALPIGEMHSFSQTGGLLHSTVLPLPADSLTVLQVYVRCSHAPTALLHQIYRVRADINPSYPRTGNLWGWWEFDDNGRNLAYRSKIDLWLGAGPDPGQITRLRQLNPDILILTSINAVEHGGLPDDYYLKDIYGNRIEVWPNVYRLNLTKMNVAEYQAQYAYQQMVDNRMLLDGVFFDNVYTSQSWLTEDIYGTTVRIDANEDGIEDDPEELDAAWYAGVFHEIETYRELMPEAILIAHTVNIDDPNIARFFNGISLGFSTANVIEGERSFISQLSLYEKWMSEARSPQISMFEVSPIDDISYGYDYEPGTKIPASTLEFARTYTPWMRFGLALTLMNDGYFAYEFGDTWHGNDWWYDELNFNLGVPLGPAYRIGPGFDPGPNLVTNPGFETSIISPWYFWVISSAGCSATIARDTTTFADGYASARVNITATSGVDWHIQMAQAPIPVAQGTTYDLTFWAKSSAPKTITLNMQKNAPPWNNYGLWKEVQIGTEWKQYKVSFETNTTADDASLEFLYGNDTATIWLDQISLRLHPTDLLRRDFIFGSVFLNGTSQAQTIPLDGSFQKLTGHQAARLDRILDNTDPGFSILSGTWNLEAIDSGEWTALGPFYHDWGQDLQLLSSSDGSAQWILPVDQDGEYSVYAWYPAAPAATDWNHAVTYEIRSGDTVLLMKTIDQTTNGDTWNLIGKLSLEANPAPIVRVSCSGTPCAADAIYLTSTARLNDGSVVDEITLQSLDGIILKRVLENTIFLPVVQNQQ